MTKEAVEQSGFVTPGHVPVWVTDGVISDSGLPLNTATLTSQTEAFFPTRALAIAASIPTTITTLTTSGYTNPGDGGDAIYTKTGGPTTGGFQSLDGAFWAIAPSNFMSVKQFGAKGDGLTDDTTAIQNAINFVIPVQLGSNDFVNALQDKAILYFPPGQYVIVTPLDFSGRTGGRVMGAGKLATQIFQNTNAVDCIHANGIAYFSFEAMGLFCQGGGNSASFDLDWTNTGNGPNTHSIVFRDIFFSCGQSNFGSYGLRIGKSNNQCSEISIYSCFFSNCTVAGISIEAANALNIEVYGGDFEGCSNIGIWVQLGFVETISGAAFENGTNNWDILIGSTGGDGCIITGCRSESKNFLGSTRGQNSVICCNHSPGGAQLGGTFVDNGVEPCSIINCSTDAVLNWGASGGTAPFDITGSVFTLTNFSGGAPGRLRNSYIGGIPGVGTYYYDAYFFSNSIFGDGDVTSTNVGGHIAGQNLDAYSVTTGQPQVGVGIITASRRAVLGLSSSDKPYLGFGPGTSTRDTFLNRQDVATLGCGASEQTADGTFTTHAFAAGSFDAASGSEPHIRVALLADAFSRIRLSLDPGNSDAPQMGFGSGSATRDIFLNRQGVNQFGVGSSSSATDGQITLKFLRTVPTTVSGLGAAGSAGRRAMVTDATVVASGNFGAIVAGTGGNTVPVYDDGTNWRIG